MQLCKLAYKLGPIKILKQKVYFNRIAKINMNNSALNKFSLIVQMLYIIT